MDGLTVFAVCAAGFIFWQFRRDQKKTRRELRKLRRCQATTEDVVAAVHDLQLIVHVTAGGHDCEICNAEGTTMFRRGENVVWLCSECLQEQSDFRGTE